MQDVQFKQEVLHSYKYVSVIKLYLLWMCYCRWMEVIRSTTCSSSHIRSLSRKEPRIYWPKTSTGSQSGPLYTLYHGSYGSFCMCYNRRFTLLKIEKALKSWAGWSVPETHTLSSQDQVKAKHFRIYSSFSVQTRYPPSGNTRACITSTTMPSGRVYWVKCNGYVEWFIDLYECCIGCYGARETGFIWERFVLLVFHEWGPMAVNAVNQTFISGHYSFYYWLLLWCV